MGCPFGPGGRRLPLIGISVRPLLNHRPLEYQITLRRLFALGAFHITTIGLWVGMRGAESKVLRFTGS